MLVPNLLGQGGILEVPFSDKGVVLVDLNGKIAFANSFFCDLVGVKPESVLGASCFDFVFHDDLDTAKQLFEINKLPNPEPFNFKLRRADGSPIWTNIQGAAMRTGSGETYALSATITKLGPVEIK